MPVRAPEHNDAACFSRIIKDYNFDLVAVFKTASNLVASIMLPLTLSLPAMNAF